eukprot:CAMPEP_0174819262 /NCGR_PEP_ID=MMETSP1107-20130205/2389_1 /TAXON_ID=36770 /ORGANISM="Paraphysomonas vestita, Strain GFlagA" /LENGTH=407 /DNA_ID=CAMNT_0016032421 /DNA_START=253 /DNA_END=1476 /DNA_ORIENTATION=-
MVNDGPFDDDSSTIASEIKEGDILTFVNGTPRVYLQQQLSSGGISTVSTPAAQIQQFDYTLMSTPFIQVMKSVVTEVVTEVVNESLQPVKLETHMIKSSLTHIHFDRNITPSSHCGTDSDHSAIFYDIIELCRFPRAPLLSQVVQATQNSLLDYKPEGNPQFDFPTIKKWNWKNKVEEDSYEPLQSFLTGVKIHVENVTSGRGLPHGTLFNLQLFSLKKNLNVRSCDLVPDERPNCRYTLRGRTDFVRLKNSVFGISRFNIQYYIEIKIGIIGEKDLREAFLQLLGGNVGNYERSPPVFITNLTSHHYILFITFCQGSAEIDYTYQLHIVKFDQFHQAIKYLEDTTDAPHSCTRHFLRAPTPNSSPPNVPDDDSDVNYPSVEVQEVVEEFGDLKMTSNEMNLKDHHS